MSTSNSVQCFGKKKTATAVAHCKVREIQIQTTHDD
jgi:ribosomal protein S9